MAVDDLLARIAELSKRIDLLEAEKQFTQRATSELQFKFCRNLGLTKTEGAVLEILSDGSVYSHNRLEELAQCYGISTQICRLRAKIKPIIIHNIWGTGFYIDKQDIQELMKWI